MIERRVKFLTDYQDTAYAKRYLDFVAKVRAVEGAKQPGATDLTEAVARYYFKLLAIKDEYEVARLYRSEEHTSELQSRFDLVCRLLLEKKKNKTEVRLPHS